MPFFSAQLTRAALAVSFVLLAACAGVTHSPATLTAGAPANGAPRTLSEGATITLDTGYTRALAAGSRWQAVGTLPQGSVLKPYQNVFTLEGAHVHEAYLVVDKETLVGFYLPAERGYSPLTHQLSLHFN